MDGFPLKAPAARNPSLANGSTIPDRPVIPDFLVHYIDIRVDETHLFEKEDVIESSVRATCSIIISCVSMGSVGILRAGTAKIGGRWLRLGINQKNAPVNRPPFGATRVSFRMPQPPTALTQLK